MSLTQHPPASAESRPARGRGRARAFIAACAAVTAAAVVGVVLLLAGGDEQDIDTAPRTTAPTGAPDSSPPPSTPEDIAADAAKARYLEYVRTYDEVAQGGYSSPESFRTVAIDPELADLFVTTQRLTGVRSTGSTEVASLTVQAVDLDPTGDYPSVRLRACLDVSKVTAVDANGESAVAPDRLDRIKSEVTLRNIPPEAFSDGRPGGWYVADVVQPGEPC